MACKSTNTGMNPQQMIERIEAKLAECPLRTHGAVPEHARVTHVHELLERLHQIKAIKQRIEMDSARKWRGPDDHFRTPYHFNRWKERANRVREALDVEYRGLHAALKEARRRADAIAIGIVDPNDPRCLLEASLYVMVDMARRMGRDSLCVNGQEIIDAVREYLQTYVAVEPGPDFEDLDEDEIEDDEVA
jgi:hypothetical protein